MDIEVKLGELLDQTLRLVDGEELGDAHAYKRGEVLQQRRWSGVDVRRMGEAGDEWCWFERV